jgi:hypothetical protein
VKTGLDVQRANFFHEAETAVVNRNFRRGCTLDGKNQVEGEHNHTI